MLQHLVTATLDYVIDHIQTLPKLVLTIGKLYFEKSEMQMLNTIARLLVFFLVITRRCQYGINLMREFAFFKHRQVFEQVVRIEPK